MYARVLRGSVGLRAVGSGSAGASRPLRPLIVGWAQPLVVEHGLFRPGKAVDLPISVIHEVLDRLLVQIGDVPEREEVVAQVLALGSADEASVGDIEFANRYTKGINALRLRRSRANENEQVHGGFEYGSGRSDMVGSYSY